MRSDSFSLLLRLKARRSEPDFCVGDELNVLRSLQLDLDIDDVLLIIFLDRIP